LSRYAIGLDYGTNSCRALLLDLDSGRECATSVFDYPSGELGVLTDAVDPHVARQHPDDYLKGLESLLVHVLAEARRADPAFDPSKVIGIGVDTTGSTVLPVDAAGTPLALLPQFKGRLAAACWLWKDHTSHVEAAAITAAAHAQHPEYLAKCGGTYSSEWFWAKIWHCKNTAPDVFAAAHSWVELCDWLPAVLTGETRPDRLLRSICAAGHKAMFNAEWGGLPDAAFLGSLDPDLAALRGRLYDTAHASDVRAGGLSDEWARKTGLRAGIAVAVGAFDAHMGAVGAGVGNGSLVKILGTSTCDIMVSPADQALEDIPGVCGIVNGSVMGGYYGIEAGQSAVGDIFLWYVHNHVPESYGATPAEKYASLERQAAALAPGASGLLALDWNNGNRTILVDQRLTGLVLGQTLHTKAHEIYRALIEATAFGALRIIERIEEYGVPVRDVINCGGLADKNALLMQIYADITGRPMKVARSAQTCALGAAAFGAVAAGTAAGGFASAAEAQAALCGLRDTVYRPDPAAHATYRKLYALYLQLHDTFGKPDQTKPDPKNAAAGANLYNVMKDLLIIRSQAGH
jgi:L-ribulokinase